MIAVGRKQAWLLQARSLRSYGSCALDMVAVAVGRFDGVFELKFGGCWDVAAGVVIVKEAGGEVGDPSGREFGTKLLPGESGGGIAKAASKKLGLGLVVNHNETHTTV